MLRIGEGTALNLLRELRNIGAITKRGEGFAVRPSLKSESSFKKFIRSRLESHVIVRALRATTHGRIDHEHVVAAIREAYTGFSFTEKTWGTYARFFVAWLRYCDLDLGKRLAAVPRRSKSEPEVYTPQSRPDKVIELLAALEQTAPQIQRPRERRADKLLYDLKALGVLTYGGDRIYLTRTGDSLLKVTGRDRLRMLSELAVRMPKIRAAVESQQAVEDGKRTSFDDGISRVLDKITSLSYRTLTKTILRSWARFVIKNNPSRVGGTDGGKKDRQA